jgi:hypothetical protein
MLTCSGRGACDGLHEKRNGGHGGATDYHPPHPGSNSGQRAPKVGFDWSIMWNAYDSVHEKRYGEQTQIFCLNIILCFFKLRFFYKKPEVLKEQANVYDMKAPERNTEQTEEKHRPMRLGLLTKINKVTLLLSFWLEERNRSIIMPKL